MASLKPLIVPATKKHTATIICAHGLGDSGAGWVWLAENWRRRGKFEHVKFIFPNAPMIPITVNGGMKMPGWYDILSFDTLNRSEDHPGILRSRLYLHCLITQELTTGIPSPRIILGGFSQGGAMAMLSGPTFPSHRLGGTFGLSCYQLLPDKFDELRRDRERGGDANAGMHIFMGHGEADPLVRVEWGRETAKGLSERGFAVEFKTYAGLAHSADPAEIDDLERWVEERLKDGES